MLIELRMIMIAVIIALLVFFIGLLRKQKLDLKYCLVWIVALLGVAVFCIFPGLLSGLTSLLGMTLPVNTLFLICIAFLSCICISLTIVVSRLSDRLRTLTQNIAIAEKERETGIERDSKEDDENTKEGEPQQHE